MTAPTGTIFYDADGLRPDVETIDTLARLALAAGRLGLEVRLRHISPRLGAVVAFAGLAEVLGVEVSGQTEEREDRVGVEEERHLDDLAF